MKLVCSKCSLTMRCIKAGVNVLEHFADNSPYQLWSADEYGCPECSNVTIAGFGASPISEHFMRDFAALLKSAREEGTLRLALR